MCNSPRGFYIFVLIKQKEMAIQFKMVAKQNNIATPPEVKYYPCAVSQGEIDLDDLAKTIASRSTLSKADCYGVMIAMSEAIGEALANGKLVKIESLGTFSVALTGKGAADAENIGKSNITGAKITYKPSKTLKKGLTQLKYKRIY